MADEGSGSVEHLTVRQGGSADGDLAGRWLVEPPPAPDELRVIVQVGSELDLSEGVRQALEQLASALQENDMPEVSGFGVGQMQIGLPSGIDAASRTAAAGCMIHFGCDFRKPGAAARGAGGGLPGGPTG